MTNPQPGRRYRFGAFEVDAATGELRRKGLRVKLNAQPLQVLLLLMDRAGQLVTREEIAQQLWPDGSFVDFEHGVNSAVNRIREALGDAAGNSRFVETLARRGYRFIAPVEVLGAPEEEFDKEPPRIALTASEPVALDAAPAPAAQAEEAGGSSALGLRTEPLFAARILATADDLPTASHALVRTLFILLQLMYVGFYVGALANLAEIEELLAPLPHADWTLKVLIVTAAILIPVRAFVICAVLFRAPAAREKFLKLWPFLLAVDELWALAPFLLLHHINFGLALACMTLLVYSPFAQRSLMLMGADGSVQPSSARA